MNAGSFGDYRIRLTAQFSLSPAPLLYFCCIVKFDFGKMKLDLEYTHIGGLFPAISRFQTHPSNIIAF